MMRILPGLSARVLLAAILLVATALRFYALDFGLPYTQARPDETFVIDAALKLLSGQSPPFFDYPWLYIWFVVAGYLGYFVVGAIGGTFHSIADLVASWPVHWEPFFLIPRAIAALAGTLTVAATYRLGCQLRDSRTGVIAALFLTFTFIHVRDSHFGTTDTLMTLFIVLCVSCLMSADDRGRQRDFVLAGATAGLAAATKYNAVILIVPIVLVMMLRARPRPGDARMANGNPVAWMILTGLAAFAIGIPFVVFDYDRFMAAMNELALSMRQGDPRLGQSNGWLHHLEFSLRYGLGLPLLVTGAIGTAAVIIKDPRRGSIAMAFPLAYYLVAGSIRNLFFRYTIPMLPFLCVAAAYIVSWCADGIAERRAGNRRDDTPRWLDPAFVSGLLATLLVASSAARVLQMERVMAAADNRVVVADWVEANIPDGSSFLQSGSRFGHIRYSRGRTYQEWRWDGGRRAFMLNGVRATGRPDWILVQDSPLPSATQDIVFEFLREGYTEVARFSASPLAPEAVYDRQDAFYVPFSGLRDITRPGPNFTIYRRDAAIAPVS